MKERSPKPSEVWRGRNLHQKELNYFSESNRFIDKSVNPEERKNQGLTWSGENAFQSISKPVSKGFYETESFL